MYANVLSFSVPTDRFDEVSTDIRANAQRLRETPGFQHGYWTYDPQQGLVHAIVLFDTAEQAQASWERSRLTVTQRAASMGGSVSAQTIEVFHHL